MSSFYIGEIRLMPFNFAPKYWAFCNGQLLAINQNTALFSLLGTYYGGNGINNFALPDLRGRVALGYGFNSIGSYNLGDKGGVESVTLTTQQMPAHTHLLGVSTQDGNAASPAGAYLANVNRAGIGNLNAYADPQGNSVGLGSVGESTGSNTPHQNMQPYQGMNYFIALQGSYPSRN
ncbi:tail fiber protein [Sphingomonas sp. HF-S3]|uniref:Tail fiber protein n=1 Tax=Sphingomonas rustica TaxID=3103142 RepID=A0ABV0BFR9_9SPHN